MRGTSITSSYRFTVPRHVCLPRYAAPCVIHQVLGSKLTPSSQGIPQSNPDGSVRVLEIEQPLVVRLAVVELGYGDAAAPVVQRPGRAALPVDVLLIHGLRGAVALLDHLRAGVVERRGARPDDRGAHAPPLGI